MNRKLAIAVTIGLALATSACAEMGSMWGGGSGDRGEASYMGGTAPVTVDPAGTATWGTGSVSNTGADPRVDTSAGIGLD